MTTTDTTNREFLDRIVANPDDDALRLVYADFLQEQGADDRAELIRLQIEDHRQRTGYYKASPGNDLIQNEIGNKIHRLLTAHPEWSNCPCTECDGVGRRIWVHKQEEEIDLVDICPVCYGSGDLLKWNGGARYTNRGKTSVIHAKMYQWQRGFIESITIPSLYLVMKEVAYLESDNIPAYIACRPTDWTLAIIKTKLWKTVRKVAAVRDNRLFKFDLRYWMDKEGKK